jgi:acyl-CoA dehydrogenase
VTETLSIIADAAERIFADLADRPSALWDELDSAGLVRAWAPEALGGSGASLAEGFAVAGVTGRHPAALPAAETLLGAWLLAQAGLPCPPGMLTLPSCPTVAYARLRPDGLLEGRARAVAFAQSAQHIALLCEIGRETHVALVEAAACRRVPAERVGGDPAADVTFDDVRPIALAPARTDSDALLLMGAAVRSLQMAGALQAILEMSVRYANERIAFERPLGKFQAIQHSLARLAGETAAAVSVAASAADAIARAEQMDDGVFLEVASAKIRCGEAAQDGAAIAHQVHGAIGYTKEHTLQGHTLRLLAWRDDFGSESYWADALGAQIAARGADALWPLLASR